MTDALWYVCGLVQAATGAWLYHERSQRLSAARKQLEHGTWLSSLANRIDSHDKQHSERLRDCDQLYQTTGTRRQSK